MTNLWQPPPIVPPLAKPYEPKLPDDGKEADNIAKPDREEKIISGPKDHPIVPKYLDKFPTSIPMFEAANNHIPTVFNGGYHEGYTWVTAGHNNNDGKAKRTMSFNTNPIPMINPVQQMNLGVHNPSAIYPIMYHPVNVYLPERFNGSSSE